MENQPIAIGIGDIDFSTVGCGDNRLRWCVPHAGQMRDRSFQALDFYAQTHATAGSCAEFSNMIGFGPKNRQSQAGQMELSIGLRNVGLGQQIKKLLVKHHQRLKL